MGSHDGRVVLVTGGTGGLGRAVVRRFVADGATVHVTGRGDAAAAARALGEEAARVTYHQADVTDEESVARLFRDIESHGERVAVLANLVGGFAMGSLEDTDASTWNRMIALNATSAFLCARAATPAMRRAGWGRIINVAAGPALGRGATNMSAYAAGKAAVLNLTYSLSRELRPAGITVNAIVPSIIDTPANRSAMPDADPSTWLAPEEIARVVAFLASDAAGIVTATAVNLARS